jgi:hypothetical protein
VLLQVESSTFLIVQDLHYTVPHLPRLHGHGSTFHRSFELLRARDVMTAHLGPNHGRAAPAAVLTCVVVQISGGIGRKIFLSSSR